MTAKIYRHTITGETAVIEDSIANHPVLGRYLELVEYEDDNKTVHEVVVEDAPTGEEDYIEFETLSDTEETEE